MSPYLKIFDQYRQLHNEHGPAQVFVIEDTGAVRVRHFHRNELHRSDGPAVYGDDGFMAWYDHDQRHNDHGPALKTSTGGYQWWLRGYHHRNDGPATVSMDSVAWIDRNTIHRENGPAVISFIGGQVVQSYYLRNREMSAAEHAEKTGRDYATDPIYAIDRAKEVIK